jgi:hypothetical protein
MKDLIKQMLGEALILKIDKDDNRLLVFSNETDLKKASNETYRNKEKLKANGFKWDKFINSWYTSVDNFEETKKLLNDINKTSDFIGKLEDLEEFIADSENYDGKTSLYDKIKLYISDLANVTDEKTMDAEIRRYLTFFSGFRGYSFSNTILIYIQKTNATKVGGKKAWFKKYRKLKPNVKPIWIFGPQFDNKNKEKEQDTIDDSGLDAKVKKGEPSGFIPVKVYDISDTEPINEKGEVPATPEWFTESEPTERTKELYKYIQEAAENMGINITKSDAKGSEKGYSAGNHINMSSSVEGAGEVSTLIHEFAHELMHHKKSSIFYQGDDVRRDGALMELQAESVAYVVMKHYELPVQHQPTYIALWKGNKEKILQNMSTISDVAKFIIDEIDKIAKLNSSSGQVDEDIDLYL